MEAERIRQAYASRGQRTPADQYSAFEPYNIHRFQELDRRILGFLGKQMPEGLGQKTILEIGCGAGYWLRQFIQWGACADNVTGIDLLPERIRAARERSPKGARLSCGDASQLEFPNNTFDIVLQSTVFSSILDEAMRMKVASEMLRVLRPRGSIIWYDFFVNNPRNHDVKGVTKKEIRRLFIGCSTYIERVTLAPPLARMRVFEPMLMYLLGSKTKIACTHYLGIIRKFQVNPPIEKWAV